MGSVLDEEHGVAIVLMFCNHSKSKLIYNTTQSLHQLKLASYEYSCLEGL